MRSIRREDVPVVIEDNGVEVRLRDEDGLSVGFVRLPAGATCAPPPRAFPTTSARVRTGATCSRASVRMHTLDGHQDFAAGEAFYWAPGHAPEALEDSEYVDFSPTEEFRRVIEHITSEGGHHHLSLWAWRSRRCRRRTWRRLIVRDYTGQDLL